MSHLLALAATLSDEESADSGSDQEGNFIAFIAMSDENEKNNSEPKVEFDVILDDNADLQHAYNKLRITAECCSFWEECKSCSI